MIVTRISAEGVIRVMVLSGLVGLRCAILNVDHPAFTVQTSQPQFLSLVLDTNIVISMPFCSLKFYATLQM